MDDSNQGQKSMIKESLALIEELENELLQYHEPIAIIGMGCRYPGGANNPEEFWRVLETGVDGICEVPKDRFDVDEYYDSQYDVPGKMYTRRGGFLTVPVDLFDADFFGISPKEAQDMDPQQRVLLEVTWEALEHAGIPPEALEGSATGLYVGMMYSDYSQLIIESKGIAGMTAYYGSGNAFSAAVGRVSYCLGLQGPCLAIDTACSSSLVAINSACESLRLGQCQQAIAGGVSLMLAPGSFVSACQAHMLAPDGHCKTFDKSADGYARAEGCGMIVLKRLSDAQRDGDTVYAIIKSSGVNQGGTTSGLTVPNGKAQEALLRHVSGEVGLKPDDIDYVEAHGTGTSLGDPIEVRAVGAAYGSRDPSRPLLLGSAKSNIGHTESAAGVAGVIKLILSLNHEMLPPNLNFNALNPNIDLNFPVKILTEKTPWLSSDRVRRAGVSSFGFSGVNAHLIIEEAPRLAPQGAEREERPLHVLSLSAKTEAALEELIKHYQAFLMTTKATLSDICYTANTGRNHERYRMAVLAKDVTDLKLKLDARTFVTGEALERKAYEMPVTSSSTDWEKVLGDLANAYIAGARVDWVELDASYHRQKVSLPTYPFQRQRYWSDAAKPLVGKHLISVHPLLGEYSSTPDAEIIYRGVLHLGALPYLRDHQVYHHIIYPGAGYMEMLLAAGLYGLGEERLQLNDVSIEAALSFDTANSIETQVIMKPNDTGYEVGIYSNTNESWQCHARGMVSVSANRVLPAPLDIATIKSRCTGRIKASDFYQQIETGGISYGPQFQALTEICVGQDEALGELILPSSVQGYLAHPSVLDGALQLLATSISDAVFLPIGCDSIEFCAPLGEHLYAHWQETERTETGITSTITLCSETGVILITLTGMHYRKTSEQALRNMLAHELGNDGLLYEWVWQEEVLEPLQSNQAPGHWLLLSDGIALEPLLISKGATCFTLAKEEQPKSKDEFITLLKSQTFNGIIHASSTGFAEPLSAQDIQQAQRYGTQSLLHLTQALVALEERIKIPVTLITTDSLSQSPINGFYKTLIAEHPELVIRCINTDDPVDFERLYQCLITPSDEALFRIKNHRCEVPRLVKAKKVHAQETENMLEVPIHSDASYLITGGLGGLGLTVAKWLCEKGAGHLILTGRKALDDKTTEILKNLETEHTRITYEAMDVGDEQSVVDLMKTLEYSEKPLKGIFHLAGILDDATLMEQDWNHFERVFRPKVYGSFYLHQYAKDLDLFVLFSSVASSLGSPGQSNYAAANAFMDALCDYRARQGKPALSVSWGPWAEVGMAKDLVVQHAKSGMLGIKPKEGMQALEKAIVSRQSHVTVMNMNWATYLKSMIEASTWFEAFASQKTSKNTLSAQLEAVPPDQRMPLVKLYVTNVVSSVLGLSASQAIDEKKGFFDMGLDSLMAIEFKNRLQVGLGKSVILATTAVFDYATVEKMTNHLAELLKLESIQLKRTKQVMNSVRTDEPIAIIGMGCRYPGGANNPEEFWRVLEAGVDGICEVPKDRFDVDEYYDSQYDVPGKMYTRKGGFLNVPVDLFDAAFFGISPKEAQDMDPQQRVLLEVTWEALEHANLPQEQLSGSMTGLFVGIMYSDYAQLILTSEGNDGIGTYFGSGNAFSAAIGRISYTLGLQGPCLAIDTACSSSLVAINSACESLRLGQCQQAIAGGVSLMLAPGSFIGACQAHMLSPDGHCKTFDESADGYARAEGCGIIVLKRLSDALRDGDTIHAIIKNSGVNHGGTSSGLTVPNGTAQEDLLRQVYQGAGLKSEDIDYIEAHGTGTALGDPIEVRAIGAAYGARDPSQPLLLGSAKSNIGHAESAAGVAGIIKVILALNHEALPGNLHFNRLNPKIDLNFPVTILTQTTPWHRSERIRRAGVSSFGFSGTNAHVIIEEAPKSEAKVTEAIERPLHILTLSAKTEDALEALIKNYLIFLNTTKALLADICFTANTGRNHEHYRLAVIAKDVTDLKIKLEKGEFFKGEAQGNNALELPELSAPAELSAPGDWEKQLNGLARAYSMGAEVDWVDFDASYARQKVTLPTYPFQRQRYWSEHISARMNHHKTNLFYKVDWVEKKSDSSQINEPRKILLVRHSDNIFIADTLRAANMGSLVDVQNIPEGRGDMGLLFESYNKDESITDIIVDASNIDDFNSINTFLLSFLFIVQDLVGSGRVSDLRLYCITTNNPLVFESVRAMQLTIIQEQPTLTLIHLGIDSTRDDLALASMKELLSHTELDHSFLYRDGRFLVPRLVRDDHPKEQVPLNLNPKGTYLVTGGLGALGVVIAKWLVKEGAGRVVLSSRRFMDEDMLSHMDVFSDYPGVITYLQMDVSESHSVKAGIAVIRDTVGELKGIIHLAGVLDDGLLMNQTAQTFVDVLAPKLLGSWNLHNESKHLSLDYFILFSSVASVLGSPGQINYAAANGFMNGLALMRHTQSLPALSIAWGPWAGIGMAAELTQRLAHQGMGALSLSEGVDCFAKLLTRNESLVMCSPINWDRFLEQLGHLPVWLSAFIEKQKISTDVMPLLHDGDTINNQKILQKLITETATQALGLTGGERISPEVNFYDLGMDSLMMMSLAKQLSSACGHHEQITPALLAANPSVVQLGAAMEQVLGLSALAGENDSCCLSKTMNSGAWITELNPLKKPKLRVFCFAHAGGGKSAFSNWSSLFPDTVSLCLVQLPGREDRIHEPSVLSVEQMSSSIVQHMMPYLEEPYILLGHSFGALVCYDVMVELQRLGLPLPRHAFLSSYNPSPQREDSDFTKLLQLPNDQFLTAIQYQFQGLPESVMNNRELQDAVAPVLKADFTYIANHPPLKEGALVTSITTLCGSAEQITPSEMNLWMRYTHGKYEHHTITGGHFMIYENKQAFIDFIVGWIRQNL